MRKKNVSLTPFFLGGKIFLLPISHVSPPFDFKNFKGKRVGYYVGSFDPFHIGHQSVIDACLREENLDDVIIYPVPGDDDYKTRTDISFRREMIDLTYQDDPRIFVPNLSPKELQDNYFQSSEDVEIVGIFGSDIVPEHIVSSDHTISENFQKYCLRGVPLDEENYENSSGALMALKANSFLITQRYDINLSHLKGYLADRPFHLVQSERDYSSTEVRNAIENGKAFDSAVSLQIAAYIKEHGLYGLSSIFNPFLKNNLIHMLENDQKERKRLLNIRNPFPSDWEALTKINQINRIRLKEIIKKYGWPGFSLAGLEGATAAWLLVQYQDSDIKFQNECLQLIKKAVSENEFSKQLYAYLLDRVNMNQGIPQVYGTQWTRENEQYSLYPVDDMDNLEAHRKDVGLNSIDEYKKSIQQPHPVKGSYIP